MTEHIIENNRPIPPEWLELLGVAEHGIAPLEVIQELSVYCFRLDNEQLDSVRYYGLSLHAAPFLELLQDPEARNQAIGQAASLLVAEARKSHAAGIPLAALRSSELSEPFIPLAREAAARMPRTQCLITDVATLHASVRLALMHQVMYGGLTAEEYWARYELFINSEEAHRRMRYGELAAHSLGKNAVSGASNVWAAYLANRHDAQTGAAPLEEAQYPTVDEIIGTEELARLSLGALPIRAAGRRIDEVNINFRDHFTVSLAGTVQEWRAPSLIDGIPSGLPWTPQAIHQKVLMCPALHIREINPQMIDLVPYVATIFPSIILAAQADNPRATTEKTV